MRYAQNNRRRKQRIEPKPEIEWDCSLDNKSKSIIECVDADGNSIFIYNESAGFPESKRGVPHSIQRILQLDTNMDLALSLVQYLIEGAKNRGFDSRLMTKSQSRQADVDYFYRVIKKGTEIEIYLRLKREDILLDSGSIDDVADKWVKMEQIDRKLYLEKIIDHRYKLQKSGIPQIQAEEVRDIEL